MLPLFRRASPSPGDPDAALALSAQGGSAPAFEALVRRHQAGVRAFLRRSSGRGESDADDLAQEAFILAWRRIGQWTGGSFKSWLYTIAWRTAQGSRRASTRAMTRDRAWLDDTDGGGPDSLAAARGVEARLDLDAALASLPEDQRTVLALCYGAGFSQSEAAAALGLPLGTVKSHLLRGRDRVLAALQPQSGSGRIAQ